MATIADFFINFLKRPKFTFHPVFLCFFEPWIDFYYWVKKSPNLVNSFCEKKLLHNFFI